LFVRGAFTPKPAKPRWRAWLQKRFGIHGACLISGLIWAVWHYPVLLGAGYNAGTNMVFASICFTQIVIAIAYVMGYLRVRSGSIWPCVLLHATHNTFIQGIFDPFTAPVGWAKYLTIKFGAGVAVSMVVAAVLVVGLPSAGDAD
jgi:uncharacterized protein